MTFKNSLYGLVATAALGVTLQPSALFAADNSASTGRIYGEEGTVSVTGTVANIVDGDRFDLATGEGNTIRVDTNDTLRNLFKNNKDFQIKKGDKITVTGKLDATWFNKREIDAYNITHYGPNGQTYTLGETPGKKIAGNMRSDEVSLSGTVSEVKDNDEFTLSYNGGTVRVDTSDIDFPANDRIQVGDQVRVYGELEKSLFENRKLEAENIEKIGLYSRSSTPANNVPADAAPAR